MIQTPLMFNRLLIVTFLVTFTSCSDNRQTPKEIERNEIAIQMTSNDLNEYMNGEAGIAHLKNIIENDVLCYANSFLKKGSTVNLNFHENEEINLDNNKFKILIEATICGDMSPAGLSYLCDCLTLAENVNYSNDNLLDLVYSIADPEINGGFKSLTELQEILTTLK